MDTVRTRHLLFAAAALAATVLACNLPSAGGEPGTSTPVPATDEPGETPADTPAPVAVCPPESDASLPAARPPFDQFAVAINDYLSAGGSPAGLEAGLQGWQAIGESGGEVRADTDLSGDGVPEVLVVAVDPERVFALDAPGVVLIYGCAEGAYRLLHQAGGGPDDIETPQIVALQDLNNSGPVDVVYTETYCGAHTCGVSVYAVTYQPAGDSFASLLARPIEGVPYGEVTLADLTGDGLTEIVVDVGMIGSVGAGPQRATRDTYAWDGAAYTLAESVVTTPESEWYPIHYLQDGDAAAERGDYPAALAAYDAVVLAEDPPTWALGDVETAPLKLYARYRMMVTYLLAGQPDNAAAAATVFVEAGGGGDGPATGIALIGLTFWNAYEATGSVPQACQAVNAFATAQPDTYSILNEFGYGNRQYAPGDLCPFGG